MVRCVCRAWLVQSTPCAIAPSDHVLARASRPGDVGFGREVGRRVDRLRLGHHRGVEQRSTPSRERCDEDLPALARGFHDSPARGEAGLSRWRRTARRG